jgi:hypothetical protein
VQITIDTNNLSELDVAMLAFLAGQETTEAPEEPDADEAPAAPAPAKAAAKKAPKAAAAPVEPEDEDLLGGTAPTMADAVARATVLVSEGGAAKVKEALAAVGAKRVSEMDEDKVPEFLALLDAE